MRTAASPWRLKRATRSATVVPLRKPACRAAWMKASPRATASRAVARRTWSTRWLLLLTMCCKAACSAWLMRRSGARCGVGIRLPLPSVSGHSSSSGHFRHDPLVQPGVSEAGIDEVRHEWLSLVGPLERLGHGAIEVRDEGQHLVLEIV